jgi:hypothetical protein
MIGLVSGLTHTQAATADLCSSVMPAGELCIHWAQYVRRRWGKSVLSGIMRCASIT